MALHATPLAWYLHDNNFLFDQVCPSEGTGEHLASQGQQAKHTLLKQTGGIPSRRFLGMYVLRW